MLKEYYEDEEEDMYWGEQQLELAYDDEVKPLNIPQQKKPGGSRKAPRFYYVLIY